MLKMFKQRVWKKEAEIEELYRQHCKTTNKILEEFKTMVLNYFEDNKTFKDNGYNIHKMEHEADLIRREIQLMIYQGAFLPQYREDYIILADLMDNVADKVEASADYIVLTRPKIPDFIHNEFLHLVQETVDSYQPFVELLESYQTDWSKVSDLAESVRRFETDIDTIQWRMTNVLFKSQLELCQKIMVKTLIDDVAVISNRIEDAVDRIEIMVVKRRV